MGGEILSTNDTPIIDTSTKKTRVGADAVRRRRSLIVPVQYALQSNWSLCLGLSQALTTILLDVELWKGAGEI